MLYKSTYLLQHFPMSAVDITFRVIGGLGLAYVGYRILKHLWAVFYPYVFGCRKNLKKLAGTNVAVITGATDGIGKAFAYELAEKGFDLVLISRTQSRLDQTAAEIKEKHEKLKVDTISFDFSQTSIAAYEENLLKKLDNYEIGVLINNVGAAYEYPDILSEHPYTELANVLNIDALPVTVLSAYVLKQMSTRKKGVILNVSSSAAAIPLGLWAVYSASKKYVNWLGDAIRKEYRGSGVLIQTFVPLKVATKMSKQEKTSLFVPSPAKYAKSALGTVGLANETTGYFFHQVQHEVAFKILPEFVVDFFSNIVSRTLKKDYLEKQALLTLRLSLRRLLWRRQLGNGITIRILLFRRRFNVLKAAAKTYTYAGRVLQRDEMIEYAIDVGYHDVEVIPMSVKNAMVIYAWFVEVINFIIYIIMIQVILKYSTREIGAYKWYIVGSQSCCVFAFLVKALFEDEPLFPYDVTVVGGLASLFPINDFIIRSFIPNVQIFIEKFGNSNPKIAEYIKGKPLLVEVSTWYKNYERYVPSSIGLLICAFSTYGCYNFQNQRSQSLSDRTKALYRTLINALLIEMAVMAVAIFTPVVICQVFIGAAYRPIGTALMWRWLYLYPTFTMIFNMSYIGCYRRGCRKMILKKIFGIEEKNGIMVVGETSSFVSST
uniref:Very-long-chain 3-oxoacyl-CoA reductase n=1 Tax=Bursaphelenchus xylophilus TaxID=6326 RepID=A0A1I7RML7_BURXY